MASTREARLKQRKERPVFVLNYFRFALVVFWVLRTLLGFYLFIISSFPHLLSQEWPQGLSYLFEFIIIKFLSHGLVAVSDY